MDKMVCPNCEEVSEPIEYKTEDKAKSVWECVVTPTSGCGAFNDPSDWWEPADETDDEQVEEEDDGDLED